MALVLVATPGGATSNTFCTRAEATTILEARLHAEAWTDADPADQDKALAQATNLLCRLWEWRGWTTYSTQALLWPRTGMVDVDGWSTIEIDEIPVRLKEATAEFAMALLAASTDRTLDSDVEAQGITSLTAGPVSLAFKDSVQAKVAPDVVVDMIPTWWGRLRSKAKAIVKLRRA